MIFDLSTAHLGDVLMAMPAMRAGDSVIARPEHRVPRLDVEWLDEGWADVRFPPGFKGHTTDAWLEATGREAVRHELMGAVERTLLVIAPAVAAASKVWRNWAELYGRLADAIWADGGLPRGEWMRTLNRAHTVICPDTGTAHMADALGCPKVIALHGIPANWPHCAPYWSRNHCVARDSMDAITVDDVMEMVNG